MGDGVTEFSPGDEVYGLIPFNRDGAAAEFVAVPATDLAARPKSVSHVVAAGLPLAGLTAGQTPNDPRSNPSTPAMCWYSEGCDIRDSLNCNKVPFVSLT